MRLAELRVEGYRSLEDVALSLSPLTALIGLNGAGKSTLLMAMRLLFEPKLSVDLRDFWTSGDTGSEDPPTTATELSIKGTFTDLSDEARTAYAAYLDHDGNLTVERYCDADGKGSYLSARQAVREFVHVRQAPKSHTQEFNRLVSSGDFEALERAGNKDDAFARMDAWEAAHPDRCELLQEQVSFFSEPLSSPTALARYVRFFFIGALEDPARHLKPDGKGAVASLIEEVLQDSDVIDRLADISAGARADANSLLSEANTKFAKVTATVRDQLEQFSPGFSIDLQWKPMATQALGIPGVAVVVKTNDGLTTDLAYQGQGVQRALMYAVLTAQASRGNPKAGRTLLLAIEEPEAFQHPLSARVLSATLQALAGDSYQVVFSTHSPYFVRASALDGLRLVSRVPAKLTGMATRVDPFSLAEFTRRWQGCVTTEVTEASTAARLQANVTHPVIEGLFATACVLVEGDEDEALLRGGCLAAGFELDAAGVAIVQTKGKRSMPLALAFLTETRVPCYPIFDLDRGKEEGDQQRLAEEEIRAVLGLRKLTPFSENAVTTSYAHWHLDFGKCIETEFGSRYLVLLDQSCEELGYTRKQGRKVAAVLSKTLQAAHAEGLMSAALNKLVAQIRRLVNSPGRAGDDNDSEMPAA